MHKVIKPYNTHLLPYVHSFNVFCIDRKKMDEKGYKNKLVPDALSDIWIMNGDPLLFSFDNRKFQILQKKIAWGLLNKPCYLKSIGKTHIFSTKIHPPAFNLFFGYPLRELVNKNKNIADCFSEKELKLIDEVSQKNTTEEAMKHLENYFIDMLDPNKENPLLMQAYHAIYERGGQFTVNELSKEMNTSRQYLNTLFNRHIGYTIKQFQIILKIRRCIDFKLDNNPPSLSELAYQFDYFDQAHFIHQFKSIIGETPRSFFSKRIQIKQHLRQI